MKSVFMREVIRTALLFRNSKGLFSKSEKAKKELLKMAEQPRKYELKKIPKIKSLVSEKNSHDLQHFELSSKIGSTKKRIIYLHGGAFARQPNTLHWKFASRLVNESHARLTFVVYPKAPLHSYEESFEKLLLLYKDMLKDNDAKNIILAGDSAGANIVLAFSILLQEEGLPAPSKIICYSPCVDLTLKNPGITRELKKSDPMLGVDGLLEFVRAWAGDADLKNPLISPIYADLSLLPPTDIFIGSDEILLPDVRLFKKMARGAGAEIQLHVYEKLYHCFVFFPLKEARDAVEKSIGLIVEE